MENYIIYIQKENDSNKIDATEKGSAEYDNEKEAADSGEKDSDSNNLSNHSSPNKSAQPVNELSEKDELKLALDANNEKDSDEQSDTEENTKQSIKPYVSVFLFLRDFFPVLEINFILFFRQFSG